MKMHACLHTLCYCLVTTVFCCLQAHADILGVPIPYPTIQEAIDAAADGDEIIVAPGTYPESINFNGKNITVRSTDPQDPDVVDRTVIVSTPPLNQPLGCTARLSTGSLSGFTITGGRARAVGDGGGVTAWGDAVVSYSVIAGNFTSPDSGLDGAAGVSARDQVSVHHNTVAQNTGYENAGGIRATGNASIAENTVVDNRGLFTVGGIDADGSATVRGNDIIGNDGDGPGGVWARGDATVSGNWIVDNYSDGSGGGVYIADNATLRNNVIQGNHAFTVGGGIYAAGSAIIQNNTVAYNTTSVGWGGGAVISGSVRFYHNIVAFNRAHFEGGGIEGSSDEADYNCIYGNTRQQSDNCDSDYGCVATPAAHDVSADPLLALDGYHLTMDSPCINAGDPTYTPVPNETDIDGEPRVVAGRMDIGADEWLYTSYDTRMVSAVSHKQHGPAGYFDIPLPLDHSQAGLECRGGGLSELVLTLDRPVRGLGPLDPADVTPSSGTVNSVSIVGNILTVDLTGVSDAAVLTIAFPGIVDSQGAGCSDVLSVRVLQGDVTADGTTNLFDLVTVRNSLHQSVSAANFKSDVNADGMIDLLDLVAVRDNLLTAVALYQ